MTRPALGSRRWAPAVHRALLDLLAREVATPPPLAVFDWDDTCMWGDIGESLLRARDRAEGGDWFATYEHRVATQGKTLGYAWCANSLSGLTPVQARETSRRVLDEALAAGTIGEHPEMRDLVGALRRAGWELWICSASAEIAVQVCAERYDVPAERVIGMKLPVGPDGRLEPRVVGPVTFRAGKVDAIDRYIGRRPTLAAGDTDTDIEMLECAPHRLVIGPRHPELAERAARGGWWVQPGW